MMRMIKGKLARLFTLHQGKHFPSLEAFQEAVAWTQLVLNSRPISWNPTCGRYGQPVLALDLFMTPRPEFDNPFVLDIQENWLESAAPADLIKALETRRAWQAQLWNAFRDTYVSELRKRREEKEVPGEHALIRTGQVVFYKPTVIGKEFSPMARLRWTLARIKALHPGRDGRIRSVDLEFYDKEAEAWKVLDSQSIKHIAPFEAMLAADEKEAHAAQNKARRARKLAAQAEKDDSASQAGHDYALRSRGKLP
jgi:hypothetical protein